MSENKNWSAQINVAGVQARNPGAGYVEPETGAYKVNITEAIEYDKDGKKSVRFQTVIAEGPFAGVETRLFIGLDLTKAGNLRSWKTALLSCGYTAAQIETGEIGISEETFNGKEAYIYYKAKDVNDPTSQSDRQFITPESFSSLTGTEIAVAAAPVAAKASVKAPAKAAAPAAAPAMTVTAAPKPAGAGGLRAMLGK
jgi:hypothetical protein